MIKCLRDEKFNLFVIYWYDVALEIHRFCLHLAFIENWDYKFSQKKELIFSYIVEFGIKIARNILIISLLVSVCKDNRNYNLLSAALLEKYVKTYLENIVVVESKDEHFWSVKGLFRVFNCILELLMSKFIWNIPGIC